MSTRSRCRLVQPPRGTISVTDGDVAVLGFNSDGTLDTSFDSDGRSIFNLVGARYNPDGTPDTSFGGAGVGRAHASLGWGYAMALQEDGKILIAGEWVSTSPKSWVKTGLNQVD